MSALSAIILSLSLKSMRKIIKGEAEIMKYVCSICGYVYDEAAEGTLFADLPDSWTCPLCTAPKSAFEPQAPVKAPKKYVCSICGYVYDEAAEGTFFDDLPDNWTCPLCTAPKSAFEPQEAPAPKKEAVKAVPAAETDLTELGIGELSALFSNLARGCEKQYKAEESALYLELAAYFDSIAPAVPSMDTEALAAKIRENLEQEYPALEECCKAEADRGALRAYTWGNKVTKMQQAIVNQYLREGEAFLEHTNIWVCTVCGFIYIGDNPPALCPVCKVPDWKFEKIQGGAKA